MDETVVCFSVRDGDESNLYDETAGAEVVLIAGGKLGVVVCEEENLVEVEMEDDITLAVGVRYLKLVAMFV